MRRRLILRLSLSVLLAALVAPVWALPAFAAEKKAEKPDESNGLYVDITQAGLPIIENGRLVNYVFTRVRLILNPGANPLSLREKEPYFRDALVRAAHRTPFVIAGDPNRLDEAALKRVMGVEAARIAGPRAIASIQVLSQTPKRQIRK